MPHALLLSPDDQAVSAITAVLEEMSVTCERPLDGPSAAKKLMSQSFDLVLVDCENLPAAKLIFDVCRRSQTGTNPVPIAIVDGRAGLPTAFRLGAELILTKPVAKDQARTTIRTAVSRVKKEDAARPAHPFEETPVQAAAAVPDTQAQAAAAGASSAHSASEMAHVATPAPIMASHATPNLSAAVEEIAAKPPVPAPRASSLTAKPAKPAIPETDMFMPPAKEIPTKPSDDPILADLESDSPTAPVFSSYPAEPEKKGRGSLYALLILMLLGGGLYAAWMYQPGFREFAQPQIDKVVEMITGSTPSQQTPAAHPVPAPAPAKAPATQPSPAAATPVSDNAAVPAAITPSSSSAPASTDSAVPAPLASSAADAPTTTPASDTAKPQVPADSKKSAVSTPAPDAELAGEKSAVILSSQGAEKRLIRHSQPVYPAAARKAGVEGTVVLKTVVNTNGVVEGVRLVEGDRALAAAAIASVKQWRYRPYVRDGKAQPFQTIVLVEFQR
ncbi:MAG: TonB family protein [Acidobacteria bacterium]|nr:TonB family protein [Acidobacteriota bacterium]